MVIHHKLTMMTTRRRRTIPLTLKWEMQRMTSLRIPIIQGRASSTSHRPLMARLWQRCSAVSVTSQSEMRMPLLYTLVCTVSHTSPRSNKTTGRTLLPGGMSAIRIETVLSE